MTQKAPLLHVIVIGFHHKKGCQVEFSYPPLMPSAGGDSAATAGGDADELVVGSHSNDCPTGWKYLPTLALPDGSHNFGADTVFFNLPSLVEQMETVFGVSCYRQIPVDKLKIRTADVTRSTVQKSVCILATSPLYGYVEVKLSLIAQSYFDQGDFARTDILVSAYHQLNACVRAASPLALQQHHYVGLPLRDIMLRWRYKALILFKLMLLQKRVVCFGSPVRPVCTLILGVCSLHALLLESGMSQAACVRTSRPMSPMPTFQDHEGNSGGGEREGGESADERLTAVDDNQGLRNGAGGPDDGAEEAGKLAANSTVAELMQRISVDRPEEDSVSVLSDRSSTSSSCTTAALAKTITSQTSTTSATVQALGEDPNQNTDAGSESPSDSASLDGGGGGGGSQEAAGGAVGGGTKQQQQRSAMPRDASVDVLSNRLQPLWNTSPHLWRAPFPIFTGGNLCLPYLSLPYMDLLADPSVRGYTIGTSNILFQQKKQLADVFVDCEAGTIETANPEVRRQLQLTTEDLRFVDFVMRHVQAPRESAEGSERWIRAQFQGYMLALLRTTLQQQQQQQQQQSAASAADEDLLADEAGDESGSAAPAPAAPHSSLAAVSNSSTSNLNHSSANLATNVVFTKDAEHFNAFFVGEWLQTGGWREWRESVEAQGGALRQSLEEDVAVGHPFAGNLSVADMKLKLAQTMNNSESGRKLNQAVNTTSKAVGGAIQQARGALSNWWFSMTAVPPAAAQPPTATSSGATASTDPAAEIPDEAAATSGSLEAGGIVEIGREAAASVAGNRTPIAMRRTDPGAPVVGDVFTV